MPTLSFVQACQGGSAPISNRSECCLAPSGRTFPGSCSSLSSLSITSPNHKAGESLGPYLELFSQNQLDISSMCYKHLSLHCPNYSLHLSPKTSMLSILYDFFLCFENRFYSYNIFWLWFPPSSPPRSSLPSHPSKSMPSLSLFKKQFFKKKNRTKQTEKKHKKHIHKEKHTHTHKWKFQC